MLLLILPDAADDGQLLIRAQAQNIDAIRIIYERYFPSIYQFIRLRVNNREHARDIASEVFLDFMKALRGDHPPRTSLRAWLFRVARNKVYTHYDKASRFPLTTLEEWIPDDTMSNPESHLLDIMRIERIRQTLTLLVAEQQEVIVLRFGQGLNLQETADIMDKSVSAVKSLQFRAIQNLRELMDAETEKEA